MLDPKDPLHHCPPPLSRPHSSAERHPLRAASGGNAWPPVPLRSIDRHHDCVTSPGRQRRVLVLFISAMMGVVRSRRGGGRAYTGHTGAGAGSSHRRNAPAGRAIEREGTCSKHRGTVTTHMPCTRTSGQGHSDTGMAMRHRHAGAYRAAALPGPRRGWVWAWWGLTNSYMQSRNFGGKA